MPIVELASFDDAEGVCWLRWSFDLDPAMVWEAITDPIWLRRWFGTPSGTFAPGGVVEVLHGSEELLQRSVVRVCVPERRLEVSWEFPDEPVSIVDVRLQEDADGPGTELTLTHTGLGPAARDYAIGWHAALIFLAAALRASPMPLEDFDEVYERVARAYFQGPAGASGDRRRGAQTRRVHSPHVIDLPSTLDGTVLLVHGGAYSLPKKRTDAERSAADAGLRAAYRAGRTVLDAGGSALDAVCAAVVVLEDDPQFNAGVGAALNLEGTAELDAAVMTDGRAGAVTASRYARNAVLAARAVMERTPHVLLCDPDVDAVRGWGLQVVEPEHFVTPATRSRLAEIIAGRQEPGRSGTVGAVAMDASGRVAAATSTGGIAGQFAGRVGDTPLIGAGTYARDGDAAVSCTGVGEAFMQGVVAHEICARMRYAGLSLADAVAETLASEIAGRDAFGGVIAVGADGRRVIGFHGGGIQCAFERDGVLETML